MAAGPVTVLNIAMEKIGAGVINLETSAFAVVLCGSSQALSAAFAGASGQALYSDLTGEIGGGSTGYAAGGIELTGKDWARSGGVVSFTASPSEWTGLTADLKYAVIVELAGAVRQDILAIVDLETTVPAGRSIVGGDFIINWGSALFTLTRAA